jgi:hypothetical protein
MTCRENKTRPVTPEQQRVLDAVAWQERWCRQPSPFTSRLLAVTGRWLRHEPQAVRDWASMSADPLAAALALRWTGGLHHLALRGLQPWHGLWPPQSSDLPEIALFDAIDHAWSEHRGHLLRALSRAPQTNEVARSAVLLPGLLNLAAQKPGWPMALLELGSSAGLNLWPEQWHYDYRSWRWGDPRAPLGLSADWVGSVPSGFPPTLEITERQGCDPAPIRLREPDEALRLMSYVWPDQRHRLDRLQAAIAVVRELQATEPEGLVQAAGAGDFLDRALRSARPGCWTVVMHSIVWQYIPAAEQARAEQILQAAGARATAAAPLAWLRMEPPEPDQPVELRLTRWPSGQTRTLARAHPHGQQLQWLEQGP